MMALDRLRGAQPIALSMKKRGTKAIVGIKNRSQPNGCGTLREISSHVNTPMMTNISDQ